VSTTISISAYNDHETGRLERLGKVRQAIEAKSLPVIAIHDHKGTLYVNWRETPTTTQVVETVRMWADNAEYQVNHYVIGRELVLDVESHNPFSR
jgi:hypothetical protein